MATTRRPDLEAIPYKNPNFVGTIILPPLMKMVKSGTLYYQDILSDVSAQTDRTLAEAPTATSIASASTTYALAGDEKIYRAKIDESEIEQIGGLDRAQQKAARRGKRATMKAVEDAVVAAIFGGSGYSSRDILSSFLNALSIAKETVGDYADGKIAVFGARRTVDRLKRYSEITGKMVYTGIIQQDAAKDVRNISDDLLAGAIGVDVVLAGPSTEWLGSGSAYDGYLGVCVLPDAAVEPDEEIQFGRIPMLDLGGGNPMRVESFFSDDLKSEVVDTTLWAEIKELNKECCYILKGIDESNTVQTTA